MIYLSSGLLNVLLFSITRPFLLPHDLPKPDEVPDIVVPRIMIAHSLHSDTTHEESQGHEFFPWPRSESPLESPIQSDYMGEASTEESEMRSYGNEKLVVRNGTSHSLDV